MEKVFALATCIDEQPGFLYLYFAKPMSQLTRACHAILDQLSTAVTQLTEFEFTVPSETLSGSSIGQHLRHTLEFFICLEQGYNQGLINYDKRAHDKRIETEKEMALLAIDRIRQFINSQIQDKVLVMDVGYDLNSNKNESVHTNYFP